jgi:hypothetical protein
VEAQIGIIYIITAVRRAVAPQAIGEGRVFEIAPVGDDIILIVPRPDIGLDGEDDLAILRVSDAGEDAGYIGLALVAGIEGEIGAKHSGKSCLQGITYHGEGGYVELARLLVRGVLADGPSAFEQAACNVNEVFLFVRILGSGHQGQKDEEKR